MVTYEETEQILFSADAFGSFGALNGLWKLLIDKDMKKKDLQVSAGISWASVTKLSKGETVSMDVLIKVCKALDCNIGDIVDIIPEDQ